MIESIRHKGLKLLWEKNNGSRLPVNHVSKIRLVLTVLDSAEEIGDLNFPGSNSHSLKGGLKEFWSVTISANYRIIFRFEDGDAYDVDYVDYH